MNGPITLKEATRLLAVFALVYAATFLMAAL